MLAATATQETLALGPGETHVFAFGCWLPDVICAQAQMIFVPQSVRRTVQENKLQDHCQKPLFSHIVAGSLHSRHLSHQSLYMCMFSSTPIVSAEYHFHFFNSSLLVVYACSACLSLGSSWVPFLGSSRASIGPLAISKVDLSPHLHLT